jgi:hypothetical protein
MERNMGSGGQGEEVSHNGSLGPTPSTERVAGSRSDRSNARSFRWERHSSVTRCPRAVIGFASRLEPVATLRRSGRSARAKVTSWTQQMAADCSDAAMSSRSNGGSATSAEPHYRRLA